MSKAVRSHPLGNTRPSGGFGDYPLEGGVSGMPAPHDMGFGVNRQRPTGKTPEPRLEKFAEAIGKRLSLKIS